MKYNNGSGNRRSTSAVPSVLTGYCALLILVLTLTACSSGTLLNGGNWQRGGLQGDAVRVLAVDQQQPGQLYAGDAQGRVFSSSDGGIQWGERSAGLPVGKPILALSPDSSGRHLYAASQQGLFVSDDKGLHWHSAITASSHLPATGYTALEFNPNAPQEMYVAVQNKGVYVTTNGGASWRTGASALPSTVTVNELTYDTATQLLWAATTGGIYRSGDKGLTWRSLSIGLPAQCIVNSVQSAEASDGTKGLLYAGTNQGLFLSKDAGSHWGRGQVPLVGTAVHNVLVDFRSSTTVYMATDIGVLRSDDDGENWGMAASGLPRGTVVYDLALGGENFSQLYAAANGVYLFPGPAGSIPPSRLLFILAVVIFFYLLYRFTRRRRLPPRTQDIPRTHAGPLS